VGVKYCFRYSQRNRRGQQGFDEEVDLATLHPFVGLHHPVQRRRREKKLLTLDQVNERFPVMTYKAWRAQREREGLSAEGGIATQNSDGSPVTPRVTSAPASTPGSPSPSRPVTPSLDQHDPLDPVPVVPPESSSPEPHPPSFPSEPEISEKSPADVTSEEDHESPTASSSKHRNSTLSQIEEEEEEPPIPSELLQTTGDNCAICIELLEDEDEVRGLTCGHCYHQTCIDPWLTQRRASCPLCKADYYIPKPVVETTSTEGTTPTVTQPTLAHDHWAPMFFRPFNSVPSRQRVYGPSYPPPFGRFDRQRTTVAATGPDGEILVRAETVSVWPRLHFRNPFRRTRTETAGWTETSAPVDEASAMERGEGQ
jgi:Ring finger domain